MHNFCVVDMSNFYLDVIKDRLYVEKEDSATRRAAQTTIYTILDTLTRLLAPILAFTSEEIWSYLPHKTGDDPESVMFNEIPSQPHITRDDAFMDKWDRIHALREDVQKALEIARTAKLIGGSLDAKVTLFATGDQLAFIRSIKEMLPAILIVSALEIAEDGTGDYTGEVEGVSITVAHADGHKCGRCWSFSDTVGTDAEHPELCARCAAILHE